MTAPRPFQAVRLAAALWRLTVITSALLCVAAVSTAPPQSPAAQTELAAARANLVENFGIVQQRCRCAGALQTRLDSELARAGDPQNVQPPEDLLVLGKLENSLIQQLVAGQYRALAGIRGVASALFSAKYDGSVQPLSVFVPPEYEHQKNVPLILMLHGADQSENELLSIAQLRQLAAVSGVLVAIPWARGDEQNEPAAAASDVYNALDAVEHSFSIDRRRVYLAGVSVGGITLFKIGPMHAERWTAFLSIAGTLTNDDMQAVAQGMRGKQIFFVAGGDDTFVKPAYVKAAVTWLAGNGIESHYYEQPRAEHSFRALDPSIERAWRDMLSGVRMNTTLPDLDMPSPQPAPSIKN